jgi:hypothetical protein
MKTEKRTPQGTNQGAPTSAAESRKNRGQLILTCNSIASRKKSAQRPETLAFIRREDRHGIAVELLESGDVRIALVRDRKMPAYVIVNRSELVGFQTAIARAIAKGSKR